MTLSWILRSPTSASLRPPGPLLRALCLGLPILVASVGCSSETETDTNLGGGGDTNPTENLRFDVTGTLELAPTQVVTVDVVGPADTDIQISLLGNLLDAKIDATTVVTDGAGRASFSLTAPSTAATFEVLARTDSATAKLSVAVSEQGFFDLMVIPQYEGGRELTDPWSADVQVGGDCAALLASYPDPLGTLEGSAPIGGKPKVSSVPIGPVLAVGLRSGKLVAGCVTVTHDGVMTQEEVSVVVVDQPMVLEATRMNLALQFSVPPDGFAELLGVGAAAVKDEAFPEGASTAALILGDLAAALPAPASAELTAALAEPSDLAGQVAAANQGFDARAACAALEAPAEAEALANLESGGATILGTLAGVEGAPSAATFELESFLGLPGGVAAPGELPFGWYDQGSDFLVVSGVVPLSGTRLAGGYLGVAASTVLGPGLGVVDLLQEGFDCEAAAATILGATSLTGCDLTCLASACDAAIAARWESGLAVDERAGAFGSSLSLGISGGVSVDEDVAPQSLEGQWSGSLDALGVSVAGQGTAQGSPAPPE